MVLDYSKWDKLELSDDSDIEVHPNVDKKSFIRWKQRDIHEKREQAKFRMQQLEVNIETNEDLKRRIEKLAAAARAGRKLGLDIAGDVKLSEEGETKQKPAKATSPEQPRYADMIESMLLQVVAGDASQESVLAKLAENSKLIESALKDESAELATLLEERKRHITAEDMHTGWDSTITFKNESAQPAGAPTPAKPEAQSAQSKPAKTVTTIETLNTPVLPKPKVNEDGLEELLPQTAAFGEIPEEQWEPAFNHLMRYPFIVTEGQKDALTMSAFEHELSGDSARMQRTVWNSTLIQLCIPLGRDGTQVLFRNVVNKNSPARKMFEESVSATVKHIRERCKLLAEEHRAEEGEGVETIQLRAVDPDTELLVVVPEAGTPGRAIFDQFTPAVQAAVRAKSLDELNEVLASMSLEDAEKLVERLGESGVLQVESRIYEPAEFEAKRAELEAELEAEQAPSVDDVD